MALTLIGHVSPTKASDDFGASCIPALPFQKLRLNSSPDFSGFFMFGLLVYNRRASYGKIGEEILGQEGAEGTRSALSCPMATATAIERKADEYFWDWFT